MHKTRLVNPNVVQYNSHMTILQELGGQLVALRRRKGISRQELARRAGLSARFLADVETGRGNISLTRLADLCGALEIPLASLFATLPHAKENGRPRRIALVGLRGAGKTIIGKKVSARLRWRFVELDELIEKAAGLTLQNIFDLHGEEYYRRLEHEVLIDFLLQHKPAILATGGGIVTREETYELLRRHCATVWLKATPEDHWNRVLHQDPRPITNYPNAMEQLQTLLRRREPLYALADYVIDTSAQGIRQSVQQICDLCRLAKISTLQIPVA